MMKLRQSLKSSVRAGLNLFIIALLISGCSSSTAPTYQVSDIEKSIRDICKNEYKIDVVVKLTGRTLWIYIPVEDMFVKADKPVKYTDRYEVAENTAEFKNRGFELQYSIK